MGSCGLGGLKKKPKTDGDDSQQDVSETRMSQRVPRLASQASDCGDKNSYLQVDTESGRTTPKAKMKKKTPEDATLSQLALSFPTDTPKTQRTIKR